MSVTAGDRILVLEGSLKGYMAVVIGSNPQKGTITAAVNANQIRTEDRKKYYVSRKGYVPVTLLEGEYEPVNKKIIIP